jgi:hypothetical protein
MLCGLERFFPGPLIRQIYPSLQVCVFSRVFGFENVGLRESTLRNHQVLKYLRHPFLQTLIRNSVLALRGAAALRRDGVAASKEFIRSRHVELVEVPPLQSLEFAVEETSSCC